MQDRRSAAGSALSVHRKLLRAGWFHRHQYRFYHSLRRRWSQSGYGSYRVSAGLASGAIHKADGAAAQAQAALTPGYIDAAGRAGGTSVAGDLVGKTFTAGVYKSTSSLAISGDVTLDAQGDPAAVFIFQISSTLTTGSGSHIVLANGASACNVFWQVGSSATLGTNSVFKGNILALTSITITTGVNLEGRALARNGAVTLDAMSSPAAPVREC